jgi:hypothetical protein
LLFLHENEILLVETQILRAQKAIVVSVESPFSAGHQIVIAQGRWDSDTEPFFRDGKLHRRSLRAVRQRRSKRVEYRPKERLERGHVKNLPPNE